MIHSKSSSGFTFIEALLAVAIFGLVMTPLFITQGITLSGVARASRHMHRMFFAHNFLYDARRAVAEDAKDLALEKRVDGLPTQLKYSLGPVDKKSSLKNEHGLHREQIVLTWEEPV